MHTTQEFQLFNTTVSINGDWFSPAQDPDFEAMAAWWLGKANNSTAFFKMYKHTWKPSQEIDWKKEGKWKYDEWPK